jgi:hypothetical protein
MLLIISFDAQSYCHVLKATDHIYPVQWSGWFADPKFAIGYPRLVTHYPPHNAWIDDQGLLPDVGRIAGFPAVKLAPLDPIAR